MSLSKTSKPSLWLLREGVLKNMCRPLVEERDESDIKSLRVSAKREGDSQNGMILFIGLANQFGYRIDEINAFEGVEYDEILFKINKFQTKMEEDRKFQNKVKLVRNYVRLMA